MRPHQHTFDTLLAEPNRSSVVSYRKLARAAATFQSGLESPVHRWFRLTPSYGPELVRRVLDDVKARKDELILDPFAGASTTLLESRLLGYSSIGFEINPLLYFVGTTSLLWHCDPGQLREAFSDVRQRHRRLRGSVSFSTLSQHGYVIPAIHNPTRWWREDVLVDLLVIKRAIAECQCTHEIRDLLRLAVAGVLVPDLTNVTLGRLQLHFIDRTNDEIDVVKTLSAKVAEIADDLTAIQTQPSIPPSTLYHQDSTSLQGFKPPRKIDVVVTSPPYPNRYSYVWNTRPHLYFLDFMSTPREASDLDKRTIGGTWGTATSMLAKGIVPPANDAVAKVAGRVSDEIRKQDNLMANYVMRYFNLLSEQILQITPHLNHNSRLAYVVGCSRLKGVYVETDVMLGELFENLGQGFKLNTVERIRKRNSGKDLHESIVYVTRA